MESFFDRVDDAYAVVMHYRYQLEDQIMAQQAAWTALRGSYPEYVNIQRRGERVVAITVRSPPTQDQHLGTGEGSTASLEIPLEDWQQLLADAQRLSA